MRPYRIVLFAAACLALGAPACKNDSPTAPATGGIVIDAEPDFLAAPWQLTGPGGYSHDGAGDDALDNVKTGAYTVEWLAAAGYEAPAPLTLQVPADSTVTFTGTYQELGPPFPDTADKLMQNFQTMYESMDLAQFEKMMHPQHITILQQSTIDNFPDVGPTLDMTEERRIHERMFSGHDVTDPDGVLVPGIASIAFQAFSRQGTWAVSPPDDQIPDTEFALYDVIMRFDRGQSYSTLVPYGAIKVYVTHRDSTAHGVTRPYYQLRGQMDLTQDTKVSATSAVTWGELKALFR